MLFHTFPYFVLFTVTFAVYWSLQSHRARMVWLLIASIAFYAAWNPLLVLLVIGTAIFDFKMGQWIEDAPSPLTRKRLLVLSLVLTLGLLAFFKYTNFLVTTAWRAGGLFGLEGASPVFDILLPLGISFYTFETVSYIVDVYRGRSKAERNGVEYAVFLMFFPHLIAGPIVRPYEFLPQTKANKRFSWNRMALGARIFLLGLVKKAVIADQLALVADPVFADPAAYGTGAVWAAVLCYTVQIYCDFSGYSDMAVGGAHMLGFKLPDNFNMPYFSQNPAEFWRRWHISLSTWLRDYLYIPLGGNRGTTARTYRNLILTMLLGGLWHGAAWTFVTWGLYHGLLLAIHRAIHWPAWTGVRALAPVRIAITFGAVMIGWVFFRAQSYPDAWTILRHMFAPTPGLALEPGVVALLGAIFAAVFGAHLIGTFVDLRSLERRLPAAVVAAGLAATFLAVQLLMPDEGGAFIYFQF